MGHESCQSASVFGRNIFQAAINGLAEFGEGVVVSGVEDISFDEFPQSFDQVEIRRIRRQELEFDIECRRQIYYQSTVLIAGVVQHQRDRSLQSECCDFMQQFAHRG